MSQKLRVVKYLGNPKPGKKKKAARKKPLPRRKATPRRAARSLSGKWIVRLVHGDGRALWRTKTGWTAGRSNALRFPSQGAANKALKSSDYATRHRDWIVADVLPA